MDDLRSMKPPNDALIIGVLHDDEVALSHDDSFDDVLTVVKAKSKIKAQKKTNIPVKTCEQRRKIQPNRSTTEIICKSDAAWRKDLQAAGLAWSFYRNQKERFSSHDQPVAFVNSSLMAEGLALRAAMEQAVALQMRRVVFESDSLQLVTAIADGSSFSDLHGILSDIYLLSISFDFVSFSFCRRETLCFEDSAAKNSLSNFVLSNFVLTQTIEPVLAPIDQVTNVMRYTDFATDMKTLRKTLNLPPSGIRIGSLFPWICWSIWIARNHKIFQKRSFEAKEVLSKAISDTREWQSAQEQKINKENLPSKPTPPTQAVAFDTVIVHTDAAWRETEQGSTSEDFVPSPLVAEGLAIREALLQAQAYGFNKLLINSDAQIIIRAISERDSIKELCGILQDIQNLSCYLSVSIFRFIPRKDNMAADGLAKSALALACNG
ncbi:hypothetical protein IGI04_001973 [Brassica rapa subsp. trilocularis]|uniref:RNase H type-1 domain-containing protein n=1 Tax=Brassica rapa subsp. trilocularis TaxID=1813537 RepID=A0ABQ7NU70_BRACM|nr:hypothetical protein IGI04_001973 [Brassica rapa subsp. trilocularis]